MLMNTDIPITCSAFAAPLDIDAAMAARLTIVVIVSTAATNSSTNLFDAVRTCRWRSKKFMT